MRRSEPAEAIELDQIDTAVKSQLERVKTLLADRQCDEAVETLCQLTEAAGGKLLGIDGRRDVPLGDWCQMRLASLPAEGGSSCIAAASTRWLRNGVNGALPSETEDYWKTSSIGHLRAAMAAMPH